MHARRMVGAGVLALLMASHAQAEQTEAGVLTFDAAFFAAQRPNTAYDMIGRLPGFTFTDVGTARGFAGTAGNVLIDGQRPTTKSDSLQSLLTRIPASDVDHIELIRGGAPGIDMQGLPVIANVVRKTADSTRIVADVSDNIFLDGHTIPSLSVEFTNHSGDKMYELALRRFGEFDDSAGLGHRVFTDVTGAVTGIDREDRRANGFGASLNGAVTLPAFGGQLKLSTTLQDSPFHSDLIFTHTGFRQDIIARNGDRSLELGAHWNGDIAGLGSEFLVLQRLERATALNIFSDPTTDQIFFSRNLTSESIARATERYHLSPALTLEGGGEVAYNYLKGTSSFTLDGVPVALPSANATVEEKRGEVFGQATWNATDDLTLEAGARFEYSTISETGDTTKSRTFFYPKPRALLSWSPDSDTQVRLRFERVVGQLDFGNFIATSDLGGSGVNAGNADLRPDQRDQYELSFERHFWGKGAVVATLLHEEITDVVDLIPVSDAAGNLFDAPGNIGYGTNNQIDIEMTLPLDRLGIDNGLLKTTSIWRASRVHDPVTRQTRIISAQRPQDIEFAFTQDIDSLKSTWGINYFNGWTEHYFRLQELRVRRIPPGLVNVFWEYKPSPAWSLHFELDNLDPFIYDDKHFDFAVSRAVPPPSSLEERVVRSQPRFFFEIRRTFV